MMTEQDPVFRIHSPLDGMDPGAIRRYAEEFLGRVGRKVEDEDLRVDPILHRAGEIYANDYEGDFEFMLDMRQAMWEHNRLSPGQARGSLNCLRAELERQRRDLRYKPPGNIEPDTPRAVPCGYYTVSFSWDGQPTRLTVRLRENRFADNMPASTQVAAILVGADNELDYINAGFVVGRQYRPWRKHADKPKWHRAIHILLQSDTDYYAAGEEYARVSGNCYVCGRLLTTPESIERGIGPICAAQLEI